MNKLRLAKTTTTLAIASQKSIASKGSIQVEINPNPSNGLFQIELENFAEKIEVIIYDLNGNKVKRDHPFG